MAAKVKFDRGAWWVFTHYQRKRKKKRIGPTKANKREAEEIARKINAALALGTFSPHGDEDKPIPCDAELRRWCEIYGQTLKRSSEIAARGLIENHLAPAFGSSDLRELSEVDLLEFIRSKLDEGLSPKTIKNALSILRRVCNLAIRDRRMERNPAAGIGDLMRRVDRRLSTEVKKVEVWSRQEVLALLDIARKHEPAFYPALLLLFSTGVRRGELLGLQWRDINFDRREILICRAITVAEMTTPKSGRSRSLHMTESLAAELFELLALRRRQVLARGWKETPDWVFCSDVGSSIDPRNFSRVWERFRRRFQTEGIRPLKLHAARHTWASMALESGKNIRWVADQLGHADPALTLRVYSHVMKSEERDLSFAEFGPKRPYTAPTEIEAGERIAQPLETIGGPPGARTLDHRVKSPVLYQLS